MHLYERLVKDVDLKFVPGKEDDLKAKIRSVSMMHSNLTFLLLGSDNHDICSIIGIEADASLVDYMLLQKGILSTIRKLTGGQPVGVRPGSGATFPDVGPPGLVYLDVSLITLLP